MRKAKRVVSLALALTMVVSAVPTVVIAAENGKKYEAENATVTATGSWGINESRTTSDTDCSGGKFYFLQIPGSATWDDVKDNQVSVSLGDVESGTYQVLLKTKDNKDRGTFQFSVDEVNLGEPLDLYVAETDYTASYGSYVEHNLGNVSHSGGEFVLDAKLTGQNASATGKYGLVMDYIELVPQGAALEDPKEYFLAFDGETLEGDGVTMSDGWSKSGLKGSDGKVGSVYTSSVGQWVQFQPAQMEPGWYYVSFWNIANGQNPMKMTATIATGQGVETVQPSTMTSDGWNQMGPFYFEGTGDEYLKLTVTTAGMHSRVADAKFTQTVDPGYETVIWNNEDTQFTSSGTWSTVDGLGHNGSAALLGDETTDLATWAGYPPKTGNFKLYYWNPVGDDERAAVRYDVSSQDGNWRYNVKPGEATRGSWVYLGTVRATEGTTLSVSVGAMEGKNVYADAIKLVETNSSPDAVYTPGAGGSTEPAVIVNQLGYDTGRSKRATAVNIADQTPFQLVDAQTREVVYTGTVEQAYGGEGENSVVGGIIDFTDFDPTETGTYYLTCGGADSYQFQIGKNLMYQLTVQQALQFMEETRQDYKVGASTGYAWRDSHQFSFELNSLVLQYMANPAAYDNLTGGITDAEKSVYEELRTQGEDEPDIVWLMKFAALRYYDWGVNENIQPHILIKEQLAYFLYVYPYISKWVDKDFYEDVRDYTIAQWGVNSCNKQWYPVSGTNHDLYDLQTVFGGLKGSQPSGHSIVPNLMMYEVALRDGLGQDVADKFFAAAYENCAYLVGEDFDLTDPYYNKGQRMSEHVTVPALAYFLEMYPDEAPEGLKAALVEWAEANLDRTENLWDIRMAVAPSDLEKGYTFHTGSKKGQPVDSIYWTGAAYAIADGQNPAPKNEPGNQAGLQAVAYAAARVLDDENLQQQLKIMGNSAIDDLYGRNPTGRAAFHDFTRDFEGADLGWWTQPTGGYGALYQCTAVIDANAPEKTYPYVPENYNTGYTEGWVAYNTAWNDSLAYSSAEATKLTVVPEAGDAGMVLNITLDAPLNLDDEVVETGYVWVTDSLGNTQKVEVTENAAAGTAFTATCQLDGDVDAATVSYGIGLFEQEVAVSKEDIPAVEVESVVIHGGENLQVGDTLQLVAEVLPEDAEDKTVTWSSSDETVATVNAQGLVEAKAAGSVNIMATASNGVEGYVTLVVTAKEEEGNPEETLPPVVTPTPQPTQEPTATPEPEGTQVPEDSQQPPETGDYQWTMTWFVALTGSVLCLASGAGIWCNRRKKS